MKKFFEDLNFKKFAVKDRKFSSFTGDFREIEKINGYIYPGFIDSHAHLISLGLTLMAPSLEGVKSIDGIISIAKNCDAFLLRGWDDELIGKYPQKSDLDSVKRPLIVIRKCGHVGVANDKFLKIAGIESEDGILMEGTLIKALKSLTYDRAYLKKAVEKAQSEFFKYGVTSVHSDDSSDLPYDLVNDLISDLKIDLYEHLHVHTFEEMKKFVALKPGSIKILVDGSLGAKTAFLRSKYDDSNGRGVLNFTPEEVNKIVKLADKNGIQVVAHAIGDGALDLLLEAFSSSNQDLRHRIVHVQMAWPKQIAKMKELKLCVDVQPQFFISDKKMAEERIGSRIDIAYPFKALMDAEIQIAFSSDAPVERPDPIEGIRAAKEMEINENTSLLAYTTWGAFQEFKEFEKGKIENGMIADFVVLSKPIEDKMSKVIATYKGGEKVWEATYV